MGPEVKELEDKLEAFTGTKHCITCASGTEALLMSLMALGIVPGDEIVTTPFTFVATAEVIVLLGAKPVFVDVEPDTGNINADLIEAAGSAGLALAIATTTTPANIDALLGGTLGSGWRSLFAVVEDASTAPIKKPHPQVYVQALAGLGLDATECLAFEDSDNGLRAARGAGIATIITPTAFTEGQDFSKAARVLPDLATLTIDELLCWHANAVRGSIGTHNNT
jgi:hypothetical protein